ncbi:MAG: hypothetical protein Q8K89_00415, partial [Actinomycetota bacterium]|nr:hypothetical protein [Actinomycetota bacterium]
MAVVLTPVLIALSLVMWAIAYFSGSALFAGAGIVLAAAAFGTWAFTPKDRSDTRADGEPAPEALSTAVEPNLIPETLDAAGVLRTLLSGAGRLGAARAAHLWADDQSAGRLRLVAVEAEADGGPSVPLEPDGLLQKVLLEGTAALEPVTRISAGPSTQTVWRYAVPVGFSGFRGVAAVDIAGEVAPDLVLLNQLAAGLRMPLVCALVLHVSEGRTKASRVLIEATRDLSRSLIPEDVIAASLARAMALSSAATGSVMLVDASAGRLSIAAA